MFSLPHHLKLMFAASQCHPVVVDDDDAAASDIVDNVCK
jgi:hypothetical protein